MQNRVPVQLKNIQFAITVKMNLILHSNFYLSLRFEELAKKNDLIEEYLLHRYSESKLEVMEAD